MSIKRDGGTVMIWDVCNTGLEFVIIFFLFNLFSNSRCKVKEIICFCIGGIILSIYFCLEIPHYVLLNAGLFIALQLLCFWHVDFSHRLFVAIASVFLLISLELMLVSLLPEILFQTFLGDSIVNIILVLFVVIAYLYFRRKPISSELNKMIYKYRYPIIILLVFWSLLGQRYMLQLSAVWKYLPGIISLAMLTLLIGLALLYLRLQHSAEHQKIIAYESHLSDINSYLEAIKKENHDYRHQIRHLYDRIATASELPALKKSLLPYIDSLNSATDIPDSILSVESTMLKALLYGGYLRCQEQDIQFFFEMTNLLPAFPIEDYLLVQILENLLSNAIEYNIANNNLENRYVRIKLCADSKNNQIIIENPVVNLNLPLSEFFVSGFSTKMGRHEGLGLTNIREILAEHKIDFYGKKDEARKTITFTVSYIIS